MPEEFQKLLKEYFPVLVDRYNEAPREFVVKNTGVSIKRAIPDEITFSNETYEFLIQHKDPDFMINKFAYGNPSQF